MIKSPFVIQNEQGRYLFYDKRKHLCLSERLERAAKFSSLSKAYNVLNCSYPKKKRAGFQVIEIPEVPVTSTIGIHFDIPDLSNDIQAFDWGVICDATRKSYQLILEYKQKLLADLAIVEAELCDCEHACEIANYSFEQGYALYQMIHCRRLKRRFIKNELKKANVILNTRPDDLLRADIHDLFEKVEMQSYRPRILKNLFYNMES